MAESGDDAFFAALENQCKIIELAMLSKFNMNQQMREEARQALENLVVAIQFIMYYLEDCDIHFSCVLGHSGNFGNDRADQFAKEATCQDMNLSMSVPLSHWKHLPWERTISS
ncbi:hypothetical protein TNCV_1177961 [Trichonephila clavipes]|nr:hypothetical protein TNCV_1177961 [Trichonephila clavipes]